MLSRGKEFWRENRVPILAALVALAFVVLSRSGFLQGAHPSVGSPAPEFKVGRLDEGLIDLSEHLGKEVIVLDFWSTSCPPCRVALPIVDRVARDFEGEAVVAYGVSLMDSPRSVRAFLSEAGVRLPIGLDSYGDLAELYGVHGIPHTVVIGRDGTIRDVHVGVGGGYEQWLRNAVREALAAPAPST